MTLAFHKERGQLMLLLNRAAELSHALGVHVNGAPVEAQLKSMHKTLTGTTYTRAEKR